MAAASSRVYQFCASGVNGERNLVKREKGGGRREELWEERGERVKEEEREEEKEERNE